MPSERPPSQHAQHSRHAPCPDWSTPPQQQLRHHKPSSSARPRPRSRPTNILMLAGSATFLLWVSTSWWTNLSPSLSYSMLPTVAEASPPPVLPTSFRTLAQQQQEPWIGPHALVPPSVDRTDSSINHQHVRIIIRVHHLHEHLVRGLIHNFRFQQRLLPSSPPSSSSSSSSSSSLRPTTLSMDFALVPTELAGVNVTQNIARSFWENPHDPYPHVYAVDLNEAFYIGAAQRAIPFRCSREMMKRIAQKHGKTAMQKMCTYDNHAFYQATDVAVREMVEGCEWCTHLVVTNDDNGYHPDFLKEMLLSYVKNVGFSRSSKAKKMLQLAGKTKSITDRRLEWEEKRNERLAEEIARKEEEERTEREKGWDMVGCDFTTSGYYIHAGWELGKIDLGGVLLSKQIVAKVGGFIAALPPGAGAEEAHNADFYLVRKALSLGARATVVERLLFFHN